MLYNQIQKKKFKSIMLYLFICMTLLITACQKTPASEAIVNKNYSDLEKRVLEKADTDGEWPIANNKIVWNETKNVNTEIGECTITVSMDVDMPKFPGPVPVYLIEPAEFSSKYYESVIKYLMPGEIFNGKSSKSDVSLEILTTKKQISEHTILEGRQTEVDRYLDFLAQKYDDATEENEEAIFEFVSTEYGEDIISVKSYLEDNKIAKLTGRRDSFFFKVNEINTSFRYFDKTTRENLRASGTETTYEQAATEANNAMITLFDKPYAMVHANITDKTNYIEYFWSDEETSLGQAYVFYYTPEYDGFPSLFLDPAPKTTTEKTEYAKPYAREYALIVVDDRGIVDIIYESMSHTIKKLNDNVKIIPFDEILDRFKKDVFLYYLWGKSAKIEVTQVEFGMVREPIQNNPDQYMMVPAWNFIGNIGEQQDKSIVALNAIDGSIITDYESILEPK